MTRRFADRTDAGEQLGVALPQFIGRQDALVLGLARGGVPVARTLGDVLGLPVGAVVVRKLGVPGHSETAFGALAWFQGRVVRQLNDPFVQTLLASGIEQAALDLVQEQQTAELLRRAQSYPAPRGSVEGLTVLLADDGLATGATMCAAVRAVRTGGPAAIVVTVPVGSMEACRAVSAVADSLVCLQIPGRFGAVGAFYHHFDQVSDEEVLALLQAPA